jgi:Ca2+-binding RTX toxin-like protein
LLVGGLGRDELQGDGGNDTLDGGDTGDSSDTRDQVRYSSSPGAIVVDLTAGTAQDGFGGIDTLISIERVVGSAFNDKITGHADIFANLLGSDGNDTIDGAGNGFASYFDSPDKVAANLATGTASDGWGNTDKLTNLQGLSGSDFNDTLTGDGKDNWFEGAAGNDSINGGLGIDMVDYGSSEAGVGVNLFTEPTSGISPGTAFDGLGGTDKLAGIENVFGSEFNDTIVGSTGVNRLEGAGGNDSLYGGSSNDVLNGGSGSDTFGFSVGTSPAQDTVEDFERASDVLHITDVLDTGAPGKDLNDLNAAITSVTDGGLGGDVTVVFKNSASIIFEGVGTGAIDSIDDLVDNAATQIVIT